MNEIKTTSHAGDVNVSRRLNVGGRATIRGNATFDHDVVIKGWLDATNIKGPLKGLFPSLEALKKAYATPDDGWFALVGDTLPAAVYRVEDGEWKSTGEQGGEFTVDLTQIKGDISDLDDTLKGVILNLDIETEERKEADAALQAALDTEAAERKAADETLQTAVETEATERKEADTALSERITTETDERQKADEALQTAITTEVNDRTVADKAEADAREAADAALQAALDTEAAERKAADETESAERKAADDAESAARIAGDNSLQAAISAEATERISADNEQDADILELQKAVWPLVMSLKVDKNIAEVGQPTEINFQWGIKRKGADVTNECELTLNGEAVTGTSTSITVTVPAYSEENYSLIAKYKGMSMQGSVNVHFVNKSYWSVVPKDWEPTAENIKGLASHLQASKRYTKSDIKLEVERMVLAYPAMFEALTSIKDGNGYEVIESYRTHSLTIDGIDYLVYILETPVSAEGVTQIYT